MRRIGPALLVAALVLGSTAGRRAGAQDRGNPPAGPGAAELYRLGVEAYDRQDYARAAELFARCHARSGDPSLLFNIAQAERLAGDCTAAASHYRRFLAEVPDAANRADAEAKLADMERCVAAGSPDSSPPARAPAAAVTTAPEPESRAEPRASSAGLWVAGGGAALLGVSAFFWYRAWDADRELDDLFADGGVYDAHYQGLADRIDTSRTVAIATGAVGVAALAGGLIYHLALRPRRAGAEEPRAGLVPTAGGAMLVVGCGL